eukprot:5550115-Pleurochrysis_carterae.AAC.11
MSRRGNAIDRLRVLAVPCKGVRSPEQCSLQQRPSLSRLAVASQDEAKRAAKRALAHIWSKTERMNCERALLSFGFGRRGRLWRGADT